MNIVINTNYKGNATERCLRDLGKKFSDAGHVVVADDWNNYQKYDMALFVGNDSEVRKAKEVNPKIYTIIFSCYLDEKRHREESAAADLLLVDSIEMREIFLKYNKNIFIYYVFPEIKEGHKEHIKKEKIIIAYHGNKTHIDCADDLSRALDELSLKYNIEFNAIYNIKRYGKWSKNLPKNCPVKHVQWTREDFQDNLMRCDIGVIPAKTPINVNWSRIATRPLISFLNNWQRFYKADFILRFKNATNPGRVYPFSQLKIPIVADFLPSYCQVIQDGKSGFLVYSKDGWYDALEKLILNHDLRNKMAKNLKEYIDNNCSPNINFNNLLKHIHPIINHIY